MCVSDLLAGWAAMARPFSDKPTRLQAPFRLHNDQVHDRVCCTRISEQIFAEARLTLVPKPSAWNDLQQRACLFAHLPAGLGGF